MVMFFSFNPAKLAQRISEIVDENRLPDTFFDPETDANRFIPVNCAMGERQQSAKSIAQE
jgi:hypothetical protein